MRHPPLPVTLLSLCTLFAAATTILFWPWMSHLPSALIGPPEDNMQDFWNTWYVTVAGKPSGFFFTKMIQFPEGTPLYYHSFAYPKVFTIALLSKVVGTDLSSLLLLHNISLLISFPLAGVGAFYLIRYFTKNTAGALVGSFVFAFNPSHVEHVMHHAGVSSIEFIPFFVLSYLFTIERKSVFCLGCAIVFYALSSLSSWYYLFYIACFVGFHTVYRGIRDRALPRGWNLLAPIACLVGGVVALSPLLIPMVRLAMGPVPVYLGIDLFVADVFSYFTFPPTHLLGDLTERIYSQLTGYAWESTAYLGLINLGIMVGLCLFAKQRDGGVLSYVLCGMVTFGVLASGSHLHVLGKITMPMPDRLLSGLPFFSIMRTASRAIVFVYLFMAVGVGQAVALIWQYRYKPYVQWVLGAGAGLMILDFYPFHVAMTPVSCSPALAAIRDDAERGFGILNLPGESYRENNAYMLQQVCHGRPIVQGQTSRDLVVSLRDRLEKFDLDAQRRQLTDAKVKYIIITDRKGQRWRPEDELPANLTQKYPIVYDGPDLTVLRVY